MHVDADALRSDASGARCEIDGAGAIAPETARRLTCDSALVGREPEREPYAPEGGGDGLDLDYVTSALFFQ